MVPSGIMKASPQERAFRSQLRGLSAMFLKAYLPLLGDNQGQQKWAVCVDNPGFSFLVWFLVIWSWTLKGSSISLDKESSLELNMYIYIQN